MTKRIRRREAQLFGRCRQVGLVLLVQFGLAAAPTAFGYDYLVRPVPPELTRDATTSVLLDFQEKSPGADGVTLDASAFSDAGGYRAAAIVPRRALGTTAWTVEMVLRVPADADPKTDMSMA